MSDISDRYDKHLKTDEINRGIARMILSKCTPATRVWEWDISFEPQDDDVTMLTTVRIPKSIVEGINIAVEHANQHGLSVNEQQVKHLLIRIACQYGVAAIVTDQLDPAVRNAGILYGMLKQLGKEQEEE